MELREIEKVYKAHRKKGWGAVEPDEFFYIQTLIRKHKPAHFLEIGMGSGLSGGVIARMLDENGGQSFTSLDHSDTFFGDPAKTSGYLIEEIYTGPSVTVQKNHFMTALDAPDLHGRFEMAFVDANHQHPWPLIDTLCLYPFLTGPKIVIHHDLRLFRRQDIVFGIGPKYLFDQFPASHKHRSDAHDGNIFSLDLTLDQGELEAISEEAFYLPWSLRAPMPDGQLDAFRRILGEHYSGNLLSVFDGTCKKFNGTISADAGNEASQP